MELCSVLDDDRHEEVKSGDRMMGHYGAKK